MKKAFYCLTGVMVFMLLAFAPQVCLADTLDQAYVTEYGWGSIVASDKAFPAKTKLNASLQDYRYGKFYVDRNQLNLRILNKDGKTYAQLLQEMKAAFAEKRNNILTDDMLFITIWLSHDHAGRQLYTTWPQERAATPDWSSYCEVQLVLDSEFMEFVTSGANWDKILKDCSEFKPTFASAKPGQMLYVAASVGFRRNAVELKRWDASQGRYVTPWEFVRSEPIATATIVIK